MNNNLVLKCVALFVSLIHVTSAFYSPPAMAPEKVSDYQQFVKNVTENGLALRILEHTVTPYDVNPDQLKLIGRYVFLAPQENNLYLVGFEETIDKSDAAKTIISELVRKNSVTSIYKAQRPKAVHVEKFIAFG
ncbi:uncharacterized protein LOC131432582 [Malaya genurostris]|uniref:uncharacterized protein LOC131432582 n=1 Tax=Malaya genurostris TaxID=325434 RepID=UPI0026F3E7BF|nr:uncharacterized protein LOC131432582 [Malaya genurostris]